MIQFYCRPNKMKQKNNIENKEPIVITGEQQQQKCVNRAKIIQQRNAKEK